MIISRQANPWSELAQTRYQAYQDRLPEIKKWREREHAAGRPSGLDDYFRAYGFCFVCSSTGTRLNPVGWNGKTPLFQQCLVCGGTGKLPTS